MGSRAVDARASVNIAGCGRRWFSSAETKIPLKSSEAPRDFFNPSKTGPGRFPTAYRLCVLRSSVARAISSGDIPHNIAVSTASTTSETESSRDAQSWAWHSSRPIRPLSNLDQARVVITSYRIPLVRLSTLEKTGDCRMTSFSSKTTLSNHLN